MIPNDFSQGGGLYIHLPFCHSKCSYCDFFSGLRGNTLRGDYISLLVKEMGFPHFALLGPITSVYYGGGTPSTLSLGELALLHQAIHQHYTVAPTAEITLECNPEDVTPAYLAGLHSLGINRLSMGVQSLDAEALRFLGRGHGREEATRAIECIATSPITNYSLDLIYGIPGQSMERLEQTLQSLLQYHPPHLSAYHLTIEPRTRLGKMLAQGEIHAVAEEESEACFTLVHRTLQSHGYDHYEVSNFARPNHHARHNSGYWCGKRYLGLGASAHSYSGSERFANPSSIRGYRECLKARERGERTEFHEWITPSMALDEWLLLGLRTRWGLSLKEGGERFGQSTVQQLLEGAKPWQERGVLVVEGGSLRIPSEHFLVSDAIILSLSSKLVSEGPHSLQE